jgi:hypothetical protein
MSSNKTLFQLLAADLVKVAPISTTVETYCTSTIAFMRTKTPTLDLIITDKDLINITSEKFGKHEEGNEWPTGVSYADVLAELQQIVHPIVQ